MRRTREEGDQGEEEGDKGEHLTGIVFVQPAALVGDRQKSNP